MDAAAAETLAGELMRGRRGDLLGNEQAMCPNLKIVIVLRDKTHAAAGSHLRIRFVVFLNCKFTVPCHSVAQPPSCHIAKNKPEQNRKTTGWGCFHALDSDPAGKCMRGPQSLWHARDGQ